MPTELPILALNQHIVTFAEPHLALIRESVVAGNTVAQLWTLAQAEPVVLLWEQGNNGFYLSNLPTEPAAQADLARLFNETIRPQAVAKGLRRFKLRLLGPSSDDTLQTLFSATPLQSYTTRFYGFHASQSDPALMPSLPGVRFVAIDRALLADPTLLHSDEILEEIHGMWPSEERFYTEGFGYCAIVDKEIICSCTAEFVGPTRCGIGIATLPAYQRRGLATATAARFVNHALQRGLTPYWECSSTNLGSVRTAEKIGFELLDEEQVWIGMFAD